MSVVLLHVMPDGTRHLDWMIEPPDAGRGLVAFRVGIETDLVHPGTIFAERIREHRREYLDHEGPVSGDRGHVERVAKFRVSGFWESENRLGVVLEGMDGGCRRMEWIGERETGPRWKFAGVVC